MPPAVRATQDICTGHGCWPPRLIVQGSDNVMTNNKPQARLGDALALHACPGSPPHGAVISSGSKSVNVNGRPMARVTDSVSCGGSCATGSGNVNCGR